MKKKCSKCGSVFECLRDDIKNCHCSTIQLTPSQLKQIAEQYDNCLCNDCLRVVAQDSNVV